MGRDERPTNSMAGETAAAATGGIDLSQPLPSSDGFKQQQQQSSTTEKKLPAGVDMYEPQPGSAPAKRFSGEPPRDEDQLPTGTPPTGMDMYEPQPGSAPAEGMSGEPPRDEDQLPRGMKQRYADDGGNDEEMKPTGWYIEAAGDKLKEIAHNVAEAVGIESPQQRGEDDEVREQFDEPKNSTHQRQVKSQASSGHNKPAPAAGHKVSAAMGRRSPPFSPSDLPLDSHISETQRAKERREHAEQGAIGDHAGVNLMRARMSPPCAPVDIGFFQQGGGPDMFQRNDEAVEPKK